MTSWLILFIPRARYCCLVFVCKSEFLINIFTRSSVWWGTDLGSIDNMGNLEPHLEPIKWGLVAKGHWVEWFPLGRRFKTRHWVCQAHVMFVSWHISNTLYKRLPCLVDIQEPHSRTAENRWSSTPHSGHICVMQGQRRYMRSEKNFHEKYLFEKTCCEQRSNRPSIPEKWNVLMNWWKRRRTHDGKVFIKLLDSGCLHVIRSIESLLGWLSLEDSVSVGGHKLLNYRPRKQGPSNPHLEASVYHTPTKTNTHRGQLGLSNPMVYISSYPHYKIIDI